MHFPRAPSGCWATPRQPAGPQNPPLHQHPPGPGPQGGGGDVPRDLSDFPGELPAGAPGAAGIGPSPVGPGKGPRIPRGLSNRPQAPLSPFPVRLYSSGAPTPPSSSRPGYRQCCRYTAPGGHHPPPRCTERPVAVGGGAGHPRRYIRGYVRTRSPALIPPPPPPPRPARSHAAAQRPVRTTPAAATVPQVSPVDPGPRRLSRAAPCRARRGAERTDRTGPAATGHRRPHVRPVYTGAARTTAAGGEEGVDRHAEAPAALRRPRAAHASRLPDVA